MNNPYSCFTYLLTKPTLAYQDFFSSMIRGLNKIACSLIELVDKETRYMMKLEQIKLCQ